jgi:hypothetical protein
MRYEYPVVNVFSVCEEHNSLSVLWYYIYTGFLNASV